MRLNQCLFLDAIARTGFILKASEELFVSQPSISKAVKELEDELGFQILIRSSKGVTFSKKGEAVLECAQEIVRQMKKIENMAIHQGEQESKTIRVGVMAILADYLSMHILGVKERHDKLGIRYTEDFSYRILQDIAKGTLDLGVIMIYNTDKELFQPLLKRSDLRVETISKGKVCFLVRAGHPLTQKNVITVKDILDYPYITNGDSRVAARLQNFLNKFGYQREIEIINNRATLHKYAKENDCLISMPCKLYDRLYPEREFVKINVQGVHWTAALLLVYQDNYAPEAIMDDLHQAIRERLE